MTRISLVGTFHKEQEGSLVTVSALHEILERLQPDVIFLEMHQDDYHDYFGYNSFFGIAPRSNLESVAVIQYHRSRPIPLVPVDLPTPDESFFKQDEFLHSQLENANSEYRRLLDHMRDCRWTGGFSFLNSERCSELWFELHEVTLSGIAEMGDHRLCEIYDRWRQTNALRETEMLKNINDYCETTQFGSGVFLVGAAHRQSIMNKLQKDKSGTVDWDFFDFL